MGKGETKRYELKAKEPENPYWLKQIIDGLPDKKLVILYDGVSAVFVKRDGEETTEELPAETEGLHQSKTVGFRGKASDRIRRRRG